MILDATAGTRTMYIEKNLEQIIYLDIEKLVTPKPTIFADHSNTPFIDGCFHTIIFDPPHDIGNDDSDVLKMGKIELKEAKATEKRLHTYYGVKYAPTLRALILLVYKAQREFLRILDENGVLWLKWCETVMPLKRILRLFRDWHIMLIIEQKPYKAKLGKGATFWVCLCKKKAEGKELELFDTKFADDSLHPAIDSSKPKRNLIDYLL